MNIAARLIVIVLGLGAFFAQSSDTGPVATPTMSDRQRLIAEAQSPSASELEQRIVADGYITLEEYNEAVDAYLQCMDEYGFDVSITEDPLVPGLNSYELKWRESAQSEPGQEETIAILEDCTSGTTYLIEAIYSLQITNPEDSNYSELVLSCLESSHVIGPGKIKPAALDAELQKAEPNLPFDLRDEQVISCLTNPAQNGLNGNPLILPQASPTSTIGLRQQIIDDARENPASDLETRILEDGVVTPDEYEAAVIEFLACMDIYGFETETTPDPYVPGAYGYVTAYSTDPSTPVIGTPTWDVVSSDGTTGNTAQDYLYYESFDTCSTGTIRVVEAVYVLQIVNPDDTDILELTIACMVNSDIIAEGELTAEQFDTEMRTVSPNLPFDLMDEHVTSCLINPVQNGVNGNPLVLPEAPATPAA